MSKIRIKRAIVNVRKVVKVFVILVLAIAFIFGLIKTFYRQTYSVSVAGKFVGYTNNKVELQKRINEYIKTGDGGNIAFVDIEDMPTYEACMLKKDIETNDDEIFQKVIETGTAYTKYYAITADNEEKVYTSTFAEAEDAVNQLKEKDSANKDGLGIVEKYGVAKKEESTSEMKILNQDTPIEIASVDSCVESVYVQKEIPVEIIEADSTSAYRNVDKTVYTDEATVDTDIGVTLIRPISGIISSRFGYRSRDNHKGLDIAAPEGTAIKAAVGGTVSFSGSGDIYDGYGNIVVVQSTEGVSIRYAHCSELYVQAGEYVEQGQVIAAVGSTGISTGDHLHFEIRYYGDAIDPQNYVYIDE